MRSENWKTLPEGCVPGVDNIGAEVTVQIGPWRHDPPTIGLEPPMLVRAHDWAAQLERARNQ